MAGISKYIPRRLVAFVAFGKRTRRMGHNLNAHTFPELLGKRFNSKFIQKFAGTIIFLFMPIYTAAVTIGVSKILENTLGINYNVALLIFSLIIALYVFFGGIKGVMYSDAFQGGLMIIGMSILAITVYSKLGGVVPAHQKLTDLFNNPAIANQIDGLKAGGFRGWTSMPELFSTYWWVIISSITLGVGIGVLAQPQLAVRFMMVKSDKELNRAVPIGATFILLTTCTIYVIGGLSNVLFFQETGNVAVVAAGSVDNVIPTFLDMFMPEWFTTVFLIVLMAAGMSTISSQFHAIGTAFGHDMFNIDKSDEKKALMISRVGVLVAIVFSIILAYILPNVWDGAIAISTGLFFWIMCS